MPRDNYLPFSPPSVGREEADAVHEAILSSWITTGPRTKAFERDFAASLGVDHALAVNSCTAALHLALVALSIGPGDEVITTPNTFVATVNVIEHVGATPVLADVEPDTLNLDPRRVAELVTPRTKAIIPVHYGGHPCDMDPLLALAKEHGLAVVEDAAHALPAAYKGRRIGTIGDLTAFSFYATKNLTTAEGGMLTGTDQRLVDLARVMSLHGMNRDAWRRYDKGGSWFYEIVAPGFKCNMTDLQAALGLVQLKKLAGFQARRRAVAALYHDGLAGLEAVELPVERPEVESAWHLYPLRLNLDRIMVDRAEFIEQMAARNVGTSVHFIPIYLHPYYREKYGWRPEDFPVCTAAYPRLVSLPMHPLLSDQDVQDVIEAVRDIALNR